MAIMTRTEAIARALAEKLRMMGEELNTRDDLRAISFEIRLFPGTTSIRSMVVRPEFEWNSTVNGHPELSPAGNKT